MQTLAIEGPRKIPESGCDGLLNAADSDLYESAIFTVSLASPFFLPSRFSFAHNSHFQDQLHFPESRRCSRNVVIALALKTLRLKNATRFCPSYQVRVKRKANEHVTFMISFGFWTIGLRPFLGLWERFPILLSDLLSFSSHFRGKKKPKTRKVFFLIIFFVRASSFNRRDCEKSHFAHTRWISFEYPVNIFRSQAALGRLAIPIAAFCSL